MRKGDFNAYRNLKCLIDAGHDPLTVASTRAHLGGGRIGLRNRNEAIRNACFFGVVRFDESTLHGACRAKLGGSERARAGPDLQKRPNDSHNVGMWTEHEDGLKTGAKSVGIPLLAAILALRAYGSLFGDQPINFNRDIRPILSDKCFYCHGQDKNKREAELRLDERDAARYADSNGFQQDGDTWQWMWRDWVVRALNDDLPFDQFTIWQLAGDLLPNATTDQKIASGFNRNHMLNGEAGAIPEEQRFVILFDRIDTTATTWLALTMACAQCHDHKYDPVTQRDYYRLRDAFNRVPESGTPQRQSARIRVAAPFIELPTNENKARIADLESRIAAAEVAAKAAVDAAFRHWQAGLASGEPSSDPSGLPKTLVLLLKKPETDRSDEDNQRMSTELRKHFEKKVQPGLTEKLPAVKKLASLRKELAAYRGDQIPRVMIMSDAKPRATHILIRGQYLKPAEKVTFATPEFLPPMPKDAPRKRLECLPNEA